jgi:hypothetical protein
MQGQGQDISAGKSRFALAGRKPMKRVRRKAAAASKAGGVEVEQTPVSAGRKSAMVVANNQRRLLLGLPGRMAIRPAYSSIYMPVNTKDKVSIMTQHCQWTPFFHSAAVKQGTSSHL